MVAVQLFAALPGIMTMLWYVRAVDVGRGGSLGPIGPH